MLCLPYWRPHSCRARWPVCSPAVTVRPGRTHCPRSAAELRRVQRSGFLLALLVIVVVSKLTPQPSKEVTDDFDAYMDLDV